MTIQLLTPRRYGQYVIPAGSVVNLFDAATESGLIASKDAISSAAGVTWTVPVEYGSITPLSTSRAIEDEDDGRRFVATTAITLTIPAGLSPRPEFTVLPPPTGNLSIAFSGGSQGNGAATTITRTRASNPAGVVITPWPDVTDGYGVSGA